MRRGWLHPLPHQTLLALLGLAALLGAMGQWGYGVETTAAGAPADLDWSGLDGGLGAATAAIAIMAIVVALRPRHAHLRTLGALGLFIALFALALSAAANDGSPHLDFSLLDIRETNLGWGLMLLLGASLAPRGRSLDGAGLDAWRHPGTRGMAVLFVLLVVAALLPWVSGTYAGAGSEFAEPYRALGVETSQGLALLAASLAGLALLHVKLDARARSLGAALLFLASVALVLTLGPEAVPVPEGRTLASYATGAGVVIALSVGLAGVVVATYRALPVRVVSRETATHA